MGKHKTKHKKICKRVLQVEASYATAAKEFWTEFAQNSGSPSVSRSLGDVDTDSMCSDVQAPICDTAVLELQQEVDEVEAAKCNVSAVENKQQHEEDDDVVGVNRFKENRNHEIRTVPAWIKLHGLPIELWNSYCLSRIARMIGKPISTDELTVSKKHLSFARILVEVDATKVLPTSIWIRMSNGVSFEQQVVFEKAPKYCSECSTFGHTLEACCLNASLPNSVNEAHVPAAIFGDENAATMAASKPENVLLNQPVTVPLKPDAYGPNSDMKDMKNATFCNGGVDVLEEQPIPTTTSRKKGKESQHILDTSTYMPSRAESPQRDFIGKVIEHYAKPKKRSKKKGKKGEILPLKPPP